MDVLLAAGKELVEEQPRTSAELRKLLQPRWPDHDAASLAYGFQYLTPLVQVPPRAVWGKTGVTRFTTLERWLGRPMSVESSPGDLVLRYLAAFGPSTAADVQAWSGLTAVREIFERLRPRLRTYHDERGRELFDVPDGLFADADMPAPVRFLPQYDNVFLAHADRARIVSEEDRKRAMYSLDGYALLVDGFIAALWKFRREKTSIALQVRPLRPLTAYEAIDVEEEGLRLLAFAAPQLEQREVRLLPSNS
jgi:hypothetical protein